MNNTRKIFRSLIALLLVMATILPYGNYAFAVEGEATNGEISTEEAQELLDNSDCVIDLTEDFTFPELEALEALNQDAATEEQIAELEDMCNRILYGDEAAEKAEEKPETKVANLTDYVYLDFRIGSKSRDWNWQIESTQADGTYDQYWTARSNLFFADNYQGVLSAWLKGKNPNVSMPMGTTTADKSRLGNYKLKSGDIAEMRIWSIGSDTTNFPSKGTSTGTSILQINASGTPGTWKDAFSGSIVKKSQDQYVKLNLNASFVGQTLYGVCFRPLTVTNAVGDADEDGNKKGFRLNLDYIYVGPTQYMPIWVEYRDENAAKFQKSGGGDLDNQYWQGYIGYQEKPFFFNHGENVTTANSIWGWEVYHRDSREGSWYSANSFVIDPHNKTYTKDTRFVLKNITIPSTKTSSSQSFTAGSTEDEYVMSLEAVDSKDITTGSRGKALDITIVMDRSANMGLLVGGTSNQKSFKSSSTSADIQAYLDTLDKTKPEGYYRCNFWVRRWTRFSSSPNTERGYTYTVPLRYYKNQWQALILYSKAGWGASSSDTNICSCNGSNVAKREYGVYVWNSTRLKQCSHNRWVSVYNAKTAFYKHRDEQAAYLSDPTTTEFTIGRSRLGLMQENLKKVLKTLYASNTNLPKDTYHKVSILSYGDTVFVKGYPYVYDDDGIKYFDQPHDLNVSRTARDLNFKGYEALVKALENSYVFGHENRIDCAMQVLTGTRSGIEKDAKKSGATLVATDYLPAARNKSICLVVSYALACSSTYTEKFQVGYANTALAQAKTLKGKGTVIYSMNVFNGGNISDDDTETYNKAYGATGTNLTTNRIHTAANALRLMSSNYKTQGSIPENTTTVPSKTTSGYYIQNRDATKFTDAIKSNWAATTQTIKDTSTGGTASLWLHEEFYREWTVDPNKDLVVYALPHTGSGNFGTKVEIGSHRISSIATSTIPGNGYKLHITKHTADDGFDITLQWTDAKKAYLRNSTLSTGTAAEPLSDTLDVSKGYKVRIEIPLIVNRENTMGGNNIPINNGSTSGCYIAASGDTAKGTKISDFEYAQVNANVPVRLESESLDKYGFYDYFMTMEEYVNLHGAQAARSTGSAAADAYDKLMAITENLQPTNSSGQTRMEHVSFEIQLKNEDGTVVYSKKGAQGKAELAEDKDERATASDLLVSDTTFEGIIKVTYNSGETDSFGRAAYQDVNLTTRANFYAPKFAVVDFDGQMSVDLGNEAEVIDLTASNTGKNGSFNITNKTVTYDFRNTYGSSSEGKHMLNDIEEIAYTVKPKNHTIDGKTSVSRQVYILPGNVISYDDTIFSFFQDSYFDPNATQATDGKWVRVGTFTEMTQTADNSKVHGYDAAFATTRDYHGSSTVARPTSTVTAIAPMVINFYGTGFELLSRTAPECGAVMVEIYKNGAAKPVIGYLVDTYLANDTLYQIPIVQYLSNDPTPANYTVNVIPFYDKVFDHGQRALCTITEEEARALVGFDESVEFHYIPSPSIAPANRAVTFANAYNVYVDGCRVYNPLPADADGIRNFVYAMAGETDAHILNINDQIVDVNSKVDWSTNEAQSGMLFIASQGTSSDSDDTITNNSHGFCLGMEGGLYELEVEGKFYVRTPDLEYILHGVYNTPIYYTYCEYNNPSHTIHFYCTDSNGEPILLTDREVRKYVGNGERVTYYSAAYKALGPANEVYLSSGQGVAFQVGNDGAKVFMSMKTVDGNAVTVQAYNGTAFENIADLTNYRSDTEMYFDLTNYVKNGLIMIKNAGSGVLSLCNVKTASASGTLNPKVSPKLLRMAVNAFDSEAELPVVDENVSIRHSLNLQSDISVNLVVPATEVEGYDRFLMECTVAGETFFPEAVVKGDYIYFTVDGLMATQMNENIHSTLHLIKGDREYIAPEDDYSIACYAYSILNREGAADSIKSLCANLLRYGSLAQLYKDYQTDALADEEMTENHRSYLTDMETVVFGSNNRLLGDVTEPTVIWYGKSMVLDSKVALQYVVNIDSYEGAMEDLSLRVTYEDINGSVVETELKEMQSYNEAMGLYSFKLDSLMAAELRTVVTAAVYAGDVQVSETLCYSADTYGNNKTGTLLDLCKALFAYSDTAKAYFAG